MSEKNGCWSLVDLENLGEKGLGRESTRWLIKAQRSSYVVDVEEQQASQEGVGENAN